ncbi:MAG: protein-L-isoaspartate O-methyltransferase [Patescibacteria group bacterium]
MEELVRKLINSGYLKTPRIIEAFKKIDRADFVPEEFKNQAYVNEPIPIGHGQTISQPLTVAFMLELLQPEEGNKILDVGSGSGWQSALLSEIVGSKGEVYAIELIPELSAFGEKNTAQYGFSNLKFLSGSAEEGLLQKAPFDRIIAAAECEKIPNAWKKQLAVGGRMAVPVRQSIFLIIKNGDNEFTEKEFFGFAFVPFIKKP